MAVRTFKERRRDQPEGGEHFFQRMYEEALIIERELRGRIWFLEQQVGRFQWEFPDKVRHTDTRLGRAVAPDATAKDTRPKRAAKK